MEIMKSFHSLSSPSYSAGLNSEYYNTGDSADVTGAGAYLTYNTTTGAQVTTASFGCVKAPYANSYSYQNGFALALELESFAGRTDAIISGMNTLSTNCFFEGSLSSTINGTNVQTSVNYTLDFFANFDIIFVLRDGLLTCKY
jgi:hypothetical protein